MGGNYIQHDLAAHSDPKIARLILRQGLAGYGAYWLTLEMLSQCGSNADAMLSQCGSNAAFMRQDELVETLVAAGRLTTEDATKIVNEMVALDLLKKCEGGLHSESLDHRLASMNERKNQARNASAMRWQCGSNADNKKQHSVSNASRNALNKVNKVNKREYREKPIFRDCQVVRMTEEDFEKLLANYPDALEYIMDMDDRCLSKGYRYDDYPAAFRAWKRSDAKRAAKEATQEPDDPPPRMLKDVLREQREAEAQKNTTPKEKAGK